MADTAPAEVWFYHLERTGLDQALPELLEKTLQRGWRALVRTREGPRVQHLDSARWDWRDESFLPHGAARDGELLGAASQTTCFYTFYARPGPKGFVVVGAEPQRPGCLKLAMNGVAK